MTSKPTVPGWAFESCIASSDGVDTWRCYELATSSSYLARVLVRPSEQARRSLEREIYLATTLSPDCIVPVSYFDLDAEARVLIQPDWDLKPLLEWQQQQAMQQSHAVLAWMARQIVSALRQLHRLGYAFTALSPDDLLVDSTTTVRISNLCKCVPVGELVDSSSLTQPYAAPEYTGQAFEASSAADIYTLGLILTDFLGPRFATSTLAKAMLSAMPDDRPTATELLPLFQELERSLFRSNIAA